MTLRYAAWGCVAIVPRHYITLNVITLHQTVLRCATLQNLYFHKVASHALHCTMIHYSAWQSAVSIHYITLHRVPLHERTSHSISLHYVSAFDILYSEHIFTTTSAAQAMHRMANQQTGTSGCMRMSMVLISHSHNTINNHISSPKKA